MSTSPGSAPPIRLGVCAMDRKARSKPMRNILSRLLATGKFEVIVFGDKVIIDEDIESWPLCDFLISFFSSGFPMDKAIAYVALRKPVCINDLAMQKIFWDRRVVARVLDAINVPTPKRVEVDRDGGPKLDKRVADQLERELGININKPSPPVEFSMNGDESIVVNGKQLDKSFVEKPVSGEDHNIYIYFSERRGGGGRRLFRKIGNKSSEHDPELKMPRTDGSYVYEQFMDVENAEDIKIYTLGPNFVHAETRKSPVVDGVVRRTAEGKEIRFICELTPEERKMASDISRAFKQNICGFDVLRANGKSYVIDVNGWSFVKGNDFYYEKCAEILAKFCNAQLPSIPKTPSVPGTPAAKDSKSWRLHSSSIVFRHADRTPKMKLKFNFKGGEPGCQPFIDLLQGRKDEIILRQTDQLEYISDAADAALQMPGSDHEKLESLKKILSKKVVFTGTKAQIKPSFSAEGECEKIHIVVKWGGEYTHAARYQSRDIGENMRKDLTIMNQNILSNVRLYSSSERRVIATAETFGGALLDDPSRRTEPIQHPLMVRKDLLDDSNAAKEPMDLVKKRLKWLFRPGEYKRPEFAWPVPTEEPMTVVAETMNLMRYHRELMAKNWTVLDVENIQARWCCGEYPQLFRERWEKLFNDFCDVEPEKFDPSRVSELYDSLKYDALHNRVFLETIFCEQAEKDKPISSSASSSSSSNEPSGKSSQTPKKLKELYRRAKELFDYIAPQEYGIERYEKLDIGRLTSLPLLSQIVDDLKNATQTEGSMNVYFTKESHIQTLVNLVLFSELKIVMPRIPELDYMAYISFEVYERVTSEDKQEFSVRIFLSEGAHALPLDVSLDAKHALQVQPRRLLTNHIPMPEVIATLSRHMLHSEILKKSTTAYEGLLPILPIEGDVLYLGKKDEFQQLRHFLSSSAKSRPHSVTSASDRDEMPPVSVSATPSETGDKEDVPSPNAVEQKLADMFGRSSS